MSFTKILPLSLPLPKRPPQDALFIYLTFKKIIFSSKPFRYSTHFRTPPPPTHLQRSRKTSTSTFSSLFTISTRTHIQKHRTTPQPTKPNKQKKPSERKKPQIFNSARSNMNLTRTKLSKKSVKFRVYFAAVLSRGKNKKPHRFSGIRLHSIRV